MSCPPSTNFRSTLLAATVAANCAFAAVASDSATAQEAAPQESTPAEPAVEEASEPPKPDSVEVKWKRFREAARDLTTYDVGQGMLTVTMRFRFQVDATVAQPSDLLEQNFGSLDNGFDLRRARLWVGGVFLRRFDYRFSWDFGADNGLKDAYVDGFERLFVGKATLRLGNFKEPFSMSRHSNRNDLPFLEWPLPVSTYAPGRSLGAMFFGLAANDRFNWSVGAFTIGTVVEGNTGRSNATLTGRLTGLPVYEPENRFLVHVGVSYSGRKPRGNDLNYSTRPEARFVDRLVDTGDFPADTNQLAAIELAAAHGPLWVQAEWIGSVVDADLFGDPFFSGAYLEAGYVLTGEHRPYDTVNAAFTRVAPKRPFRNGNPFKKESNGGALEVAARYSAVDLNEGLIRGGAERNVSLGLNWYLSAVSRVAFNYVHASVQDSGSAHIFLLRYQFNPRRRRTDLTPHN